MYCLTHRRCLKEKEKKAGCRFEGVRVLGTEQAKDVGWKGCPIHEGLLDDSETRLEGSEPDK